MSKRITKKTLRGMVESLNEEYDDVELHLHVWSPGSRNFYRLRDSDERDIGPGGNNREMLYFLKGIQYANNGWIK